MPTILELAGLPHHPRGQAPSLLPLMRGKLDRVREFAVSSWLLPQRSRSRPSTFWA